MSILDKNIDAPLPVVADWWDIELRINVACTRPFIPDEALNHLQTIPRWVEFVRRKILEQRCNADDHMFTFICESIIKGELDYINDVQVGWPIMRDEDIVYCIMVVTKQHNKESIGQIITKRLHG